MTKCNSREPVDLATTKHFQMELRQLDEDAIVDRLICNIALKEGTSLQELKKEVLAKKQSDVTEFAAIKAFTLLYLSYGE